MIKKIIVVVMIVACSMMAYAGEKNVAKKTNSKIVKLTYADGVVRYEGEVASGEPNGKGISYDQTGKKMYEGMFKNGVANGMGKMYDEAGNLSFEGEVKNGIPTENGKWFVPEVKPNAKKVEAVKEENSVISELKVDSTQNRVAFVQEEKSEEVSSKSEEDEMFEMIKDVLAIAGKYDKKAN